MFREKFQIVWLEVKKIHGQSPNLLRMQLYTIDQNLFQIHIWITLKVSQFIDHTLLLFWFIKFVKTDFFFQISWITTKTTRGLKSETPLPLQTYVIIFRLGPHFCKKEKEFLKSGIIFVDYLSDLAKYVSELKSSNLGNCRNELPTATV